MPVTHRTDIRPHFHRRITEGFITYANDKATAAGLQLARMMLDYRAPDGPDVYGYQLDIGRVMTELRDNGVTEKDVLIRVAEFVAFMEASPHRFRSQSEEDFALSRGVIHLVRWKAGGRRYGARLLKHLGPLIREHCYAWALALVRKLSQEIDVRRSLLRQAMDFGDRPNAAS